ncbi:MAG: hypothetical protein JWM27_4919 [Gemmatimonadetes bacterium]|nr:hypothetical protein [Gemmatimonadota bacterium]
MSIRSLLSTVALVAVASPLRAQLPASMGTAAGLAGTAVTEARRADAAAWNPALLGIYDGPVRTTSILGVDAGALPGGEIFGAAARLGLVGGHVEATRLGSLGKRIPWGASSLDAAAQVRWVAIQSRDLGITVDTRYATSGAVPTALAADLGARGVGPDVWQERPVSRSLTSVLTVGKGRYLGELPVLGRVWTGVAVKGWWAHTVARGSFEADLPSAEVYRETVLGNAGGAGADAGVAGFAAGRLWYGLSVTNVYATSFRPGRGPRTRAVQAEVAADGGLTLHETLSPVIADDDPDAVAVAHAKDLWDETRFPSVLRVGAAWQAGWGTLAAAASETIRSGGLDPSGVEAPRSVAWHDAASRFRLAYGWGKDRSIAEAAFSLGRCDRRWTAGFRRAAGGSYGLTLDLSLSDFACSLHTGAR